MKDEESLIRLGSIEGKVDVMTTMLKTKLDDHENRLRKAEHKIWTSGGAWSMMAVVFSATLYKLFH